MWRWIGWRKWNKIVTIVVVIIIVRVVSSSVCVQRQEHTQRNYLSSKQSTRRANVFFWYLQLRVNILIKEISGIGCVGGERKRNRMEWAGPLIGPMMEINKHLPSIPSLLRQLNHSWRSTAWLPFMSHDLANPLAHFNGFTIFLTILLKSLYSFFVNTPDLSSSILLNFHSSTLRSKSILLPVLITVELCSRFHSEWKIRIKLLLKAALSDVLQIFTPFLGFDDLRLVDFLCLPHLGQLLLVYCTVVYGKGIPCGVTHQQ